MPNEAQHLDTAFKNKNAMSFLLTQAEKFPEWVAVTAFYSALHIVDAGLYNKYDEHGRTHLERNQIIKKKNPPLWKFYKRLYDASIIARYLQDDAGSVHLNFLSVYPIENVREKIAKEFLEKVILQTHHMLSATGKKHIDGFFS